MRGDAKLLAVSFSAHGTFVAEFDGSACLRVGRPAMSSQHQSENGELQEDEKHGLPSDGVPGGEKYDVLQGKRVQVG